MRLKTKIYNLIINNKNEIEKLSPDFLYKLEKIYFSEVNKLSRLFVYRDPVYNKGIATEYFEEELGYALNKLRHEIKTIYRLQVLLRCFCKQVFIPQINLTKINTLSKNIKNKLKMYKELIR